jgi:hypothetical protein
MKFKKSIRKVILYAQNQSHIRLYGITMTLFFFVIVQSCFLASEANSLGENNVSSNLLSSLPKQGPIKKLTSALDITNPSVNSTPLQQMPSNMQEIRDVVNATAIDIRNTIKKIISDIRNDLLQIGITFGEIGSIVAALVVIITLIRRPWLGIDKAYSPLVRRIQLVAYDINDSRIPFDLSTFKISYTINTVVVRNMGFKAAKNCKGVLKIGNDEVKVYWYGFLQPSQMEGMTINPHSIEYLDLFAIIEGDVLEVFNSLSENISKLKSYVNNDPSLSQALSARIDMISDKYKSAKDIPQIIIQHTKDGWMIRREKPSYYKTIEVKDRQSIMVESNIPTERTKEITKVIVTSENANRLQKHITILTNPSDPIGAAIKF